jgi:hypothetical protein
MTPIDAAHAAAESAGSEDARRAWWGVVAAAELHVWLAAEPRGADLPPRVFEIDGASYTLAFDTEDRLAAFAGGVAVHATLRGRRLAALLAQAGLGLGLNFGAPSETLLPPDAMAWLAGFEDEGPRRVEARPDALGPPTLAAQAVALLDARLAAVPDLARRAWLCTATWPDGTVRPLLAVEEAVPDAADAIARFLGEALAFAGIETPLDVLGVTAGSSLVPRLDRVALRFDIAPPGPGRDPAKPPRLR